jgi:hypothetical protein
MTRRSTPAAVTHAPHPDYPTKGACGQTTRRFSNPPTCEACLKRKAEWDADDEQTAITLGLR